MSVARTLERRLEQLVGRFAGRVFSGRVHPSEIVTRVVREVDFARFQHEAGPASANRYRIILNPAALTGDATELEQSIAGAIEEHAAFEGLRLEGPVTVSVSTSDSVAPSQVECHVEIAPGDPVPWARLIAGDVSLSVGRNRAIVGRGDDADVVVTGDDVSRRHALVWRQGGRHWIRDLGSANGTTVDGHPVTATARPIEEGAMVGFGSRRFRFVTV